MKISPPFHNKYLDPDRIGNAAIPGPENRQETTESSRFTQKTVDELGLQIRTDAITLLDPNISGRTAKAELSRVYGETRYENYVEELRRDRKNRKIDLVAKRNSELKELLRNGEISIEEYRNTQNIERLIPLEQRLLEDLFETDKKTVLTEILRLLTDQFAELPNGLNITQNIHRHLIHNRLTEILYTAPKNSDLKEYLYEVVLKLSKLVNNYLRNPYFEGKQSGIIEMVDIYLAKIIYPGYRVEMRVGFGGSEDEVNIRSCSYVIPALEEMKQFLLLGISPPELVITHGAKLALECNGMDSDKVNKNYREITTLIERFIERFYPELTAFVRFTELESSEIQSNRIQSRLKMLREIEENTDQKKNTISRLIESLGEYETDDILAIIQKPEANLTDEDKSILNKIAIAWYNLKFKECEEIQKSEIINRIIQLKSKSLEAKLTQQKQKINGLIKTINNLRVLPDPPEKRIEILEQQLRELQSLIGDSNSVSEIDVEVELNSRDPRHQAQLHAIFEEQFGQLQDLFVPYRECSRVKNSIQTLIRLGEHHNSKDSECTLLYIAAHPDEKVFGDIQSVKGRKPHVVIKFGGIGENHFNVAQAWLAAQNQEPETYRPNSTFGQDSFTKYRTLNFGGKPPVYYNAGDSEITIHTLRSFTSWQSVLDHYRERLPDCLHDLQVLPSEYYDFLINYSNE